jgi:hypothetical protein
VGWVALLRRKLRSARRLSASDWRVLARAWYLLLLADVGLRVLPFRRVQRGVPPAADVLVGPSEEIAATLRRLRQLVDMAARNHLYPMTCLRRALVLQRMLAQRGIATKLEIGVRKEAGALAAHAWLEYDGQPIGQPEAIAARYAPLATVRETR